MKKESLTNDLYRAEHILVCLSASPSNAKIIKTAAKMATAFKGNFTALYVQTRESEKMVEADKARLKQNLRLAEQLGANITTVYGDDVSFQIAEFARISSVTKIVIGRSNARRRHFWSKPTLTERLAETVPNLEVHIIPDNTVKYRHNSSVVLKRFIPSVKDILISLVILLGTTLLGLAFYQWGFTDSNIITVYILGVLLTSLFTKGYFCGVVSSLASVMLFNFLFTEPRLTFHAYDSGYPVTFVVMLAAAIITGTLASKLKSHAKLSAQAAFRTKVLLDTNQLLQKAQNDEDIIGITATQLMKLLDKTVVVYSANGDSPSRAAVFSADGDTAGESLLFDKERNAAEWVFKNGRSAGSTTDKYSDSRCIYLPVQINGKVYGVVGICINGRSLDSFETNILLSILGECALALDNSRNAKEKEQAAVLVKNEKLRANLLRAISHDLRTPLTSISGNAANLLSNCDKMDRASRLQTFTDIFDDSQWLIGLVENLLSITRLEDGKINFNMSVQLMDEVIAEALKHVNRKSAEHNLTVECKDELLMARMDAKLIIQVIINLVDNAVKYTPAGSNIKLSAQKKGDFVFVFVADNGKGISDEEKPRVFEMFYTGADKRADSHRSLGLGLPLCRSIIAAHGGEITLTDNEGGGCVFSFTIPTGEVCINE